MKYVWVGALVFGNLLFARTQDSETNINTRYTVETVIVSGNGWTTDVAAEHDPKFSGTLSKRLSSLIGDKLNPSALDEVGRRLRKELNARAVTRHVLRGGRPEYVKVVFKVQERANHFDVSVPKFLYNAQQGWSGAVEGSETVKQHRFTFGLVSDGDELAERFAGIHARYENSSLGTSRVRFAFQFESYHQQWNSATIEARDASEIYRARQNFEPEITFALAKPLTVSFGGSFERLQSQYPAARTEAANSAVTSVRYHHQTEGAETAQDFDGGYNLRAATGMLGSDFAYARHRGEFRYTLTRGRHTLIDDASGGILSGRAPLFERYFLGNSSTLRGWNKFDLDPVGGNRMAHNSVEYRYGLFETFYDVGAVWDSGQTATVRHGVGGRVALGRLRPGGGVPRTERTDRPDLYDGHELLMARHARGSGDQPQELAAGRPGHSLVPRRRRQWPLGGLRRGQPAPGGHTALIFLPAGPWRSIVCTMATRWFSWPACRCSPRTRT